jgi:hypothetical protein
MWVRWLCLSLVFPVKSHSGLIKDPVTEITVAVKPVSFTYSMWIAFEPVTPEAVFRSLDRGGNLCRIGNVEPKNQSIASFCQLLEQLGFSGRRDQAMTALQHMFRGRTSEACGASGDQPDGSGIAVGFHGVVLNFNRCDPFIE